ncbi:MAG: hypothetical protein H6510_16675 [Acidobacteria bacterium]|nr:hypothetical protein [Acidobacteriota bacterium]MCB9399450.1 hypothetical protein [Acidobacteriota bacterium]
MRTVIAFGLLGFLVACQKPVVPYSQMLESLRAEPYTTIVDQYPYRISLNYQPVWALAQRDLKDKVPADTQALGQILDVYRGGVSFILRVGPHPDLPPDQHKATDIVNYQPDQATFSANLHHLFYGLNDSIYIVTESGEKIPVGLYQLDRNWGITTTNRFSLQFPQVFNNEDLSKMGSFQVVVQNLAPQLPELRFDFKQNPVRLANYSLEHLLQALQAPQPPTKE